MSVKIRLSRGGTTNAPFYNIVATDSRSPRDGKFLEKLGFYNPNLSDRNNLKGTKKAETDLNKRLSFNEERVKYWLSVGAEFSETVAKLLKSSIAGLEKFIKPIPENKPEFFGVSRKEKKKVLLERAEAAKKVAAEKKKAASDKAKAEAQANA
jgi:small subunit ribosomal protein S16